MGLALVALAVLLEAVGQLALKQGAERAHAETSKWGWVRGLWGNRAVALGILCFIAHGVLWTMAIRLLDISIAFPVKQHRIRLCGPAVKDLVARTGGPRAVDWLGIYSWRRGAGWVKLSDQFCLPAESYRGVIQI